MERLFSGCLIAAMTTPAVILNTLPMWSGIPTAFICSVAFITLAYQLKGSIDG